MDSCQSIKFELKVIKAVIHKENLDGLSNGNNIIIVVVDKIRQKTKISQQSATSNLYFNKTMIFEVPNYDIKSTKIRIMCFEE